MPVTPAGAIQVRNPMSFIGGTPLYAATGGVNESTQLQSTLSAATSGPELPPGVGHHPITCTSTLEFDENGAFSCEHYRVAPDDPRLHLILVHGLALMIIEEALKL